MEQSPIHHSLPDSHISHIEPLFPSPSPFSHGSCSHHAFYCQPFLEVVLTSAIPTSGLQVLQSMLKVSVMSIKWSTIPVLPYPHVHQTHLHGSSSLLTEPLLTTRPIAHPLTILSPHNITQDTTHPPRQHSQTVMPGDHSSRSHMLHPPSYFPSCTLTPAPPLATSCAHSMHQAHFHVPGTPNLHEPSGP